MLHDGLSSGALSTIDGGASSKNKMIACPKRVPDSTNLLVITGEVRLSRVILEVESRFLVAKKV